MPQKNIRMAFVYDFDGTLAPGNLQENSFIPEIGMKSSDFWDEVNQRARKQQADPILIYMQLMLEKARSVEPPEKRVSVRLDEFRRRGAEIQFFQGVPDWFDRIKEYGKCRGLKIEHYIISSGNGEIIDGTSIARKFEKIYASRFVFDENDVACWPALAINFTTKTQFLFRINKDAHDLSDDKKINEFVPEECRPIPFKNMVYIGDGQTDVPCFRLVRAQGGLSIGVYEPSAKNARKKAKLLSKDGRVHYVVPANYEKASKLDSIVKAQIDFVVARDSLDRLAK